MGPKKRESTRQDDLFRDRLVNLINPRHPLVQLAKIIDWQAFEHEWGLLFTSKQGAPAISTRLIAGLHYLKHTYGLSDESVVERWVENPYWQHFCGEEFFQHQEPLHPTSLTRWRQRIGEEGCEWLLSKTIEAGLATKTVEKRHLERVTVDTTVQEKAITFPTDGKLYLRCLKHLVKLSHQHGLLLRQTYVRKGPEALLRSNRYAHAKQMKRKRRAIKKLKTYLGRVNRDIGRQLEDQPDSVQAAFAHKQAQAKKLLEQTRNSKHKLYSLHAPEVECIAKGKAHQRYEFGVKVSVATTNRSNFVVGARSFPNNPYDGHTLSEALEQVEILTDIKPKRCYVDRGYRGVEIPGTMVYRSGQRRGINTRTLKRELKRRQAVEPVIGHMKNDGLLGRNYLKGQLGDAMHAILCAAGHNMRLILRKLRLLWAFFRYRILTNTNRAFISRLIFSLRPRLVFITVGI